MARQQQSQANTLFNQSQAAGQQAGANASSIYGQLFPTYSAEAEGKPTAGTIAENTAAQQSVGGSTAGAVGLGNLEAARTGNAGANSVAMDNAVRSGEHSLSNTASDITANEVNSGQKGLASLYGSNVGQEGQDMSLGNEAVNAGVNAGKSGWFQNLLGGMSAISGAGNSAANLGFGRGGA